MTNVMHMVNDLNFRTSKFPIKWHNYANSADPDQTAPKEAV